MEGVKLKLKSLDENLCSDLKDPERAAAYLENALSGSLEQFLVALRKYVQANGGVAKCAEKTHLSREALYRMLSEQGNPEFRSVEAILKSLGLRLSVTRDPKAA